MAKKMIGITVLMIMLFGTAEFKCYTVPLDRYFDSEIELRQAAPHLYYFDFDLPEMEFQRARGLGGRNDKQYSRYHVWYYFTSDEFGEIALGIECNSTSMGSSSNELNNVETIIDGMHCFLRYGVFEEGYFFIRITLELENDLYFITFGRAFFTEQTPEEEQAFIAYFFEVVTPAIENRSKYLLKE